MQNEGFLAVFRARCAFLCRRLPVHDLGADAVDTDTGETLRYLRCSPHLLLSTCPQRDGRGGETRSRGAGLEPESLG